MKRLQSYIGGVKMRDVASAGVVAILAAVGLAVFCWWLTFVMAVDFYGYWPDFGYERAGGGAVYPRGGGMMDSFGGVFVMWGVMMGAMMLPSFLPLLILFARWQRFKVGGGTPREFASQMSRPPLASQAGVTVMGVVRVWGLTLGYLLAWGGFSFLAAVFQWFASAVALLDDSLVLSHPLLRAGVLLVAGGFQFSRLKLRCLRGCRQGALFFVLYWRDGVFGALRMGVFNGVLCVGCCGFLMALLFVGGVMDLRWIVGLALWALVEKVSPFSARRTAGVGGVVLLGLAGWEVAGYYL